MIDRLLKLIVTLTLLLFLLQVIVGGLSRLFEVAFLAPLSAIMQGGASFSGLVLTAVGLCFFAGLLVRLAKFANSRDPRSARDRASRERSMRRRSRHPAEGVEPVYDRRRELTDPDPAVGDEWGHS